MLPRQRPLPHAPTSIALTIPVITLLVMLTASASQARATDDGASLALARFVSCSAPGMAGLTDLGDIVIEIDAFLPQIGKRGRFEGIRHRGPTGAPEYELISFDGDSTVKDQVISRYITGEQQVYNRPAASFAVTPDNYNFRYMASIGGGADRFFIFAIKPRHRAEGLMEGQIWIDAAGALLHQEGRLVKQASAFIRRIEIVRDTGSRAASPYFRVTRVGIKTRGFGRAELTIRERPAS